MKKLIVLLLALMLLAGTALAEDGLYISEAPNTSGFSGKSLTPESYPMARLTPFASQIVSGKADAVFLSFPGPDGTNIWDVQSDLVTYLDSENLIRYDYIIYKSNSYEEFINKAEKEEYILLDGSDGKAAYISPEAYTPSARGMIATKEFDKSSKLVIEISLYNAKDETVESVSEKLSGLITAELDRLSALMTYETISPYWSAGQYTGVRFVTYSRKEGPMCAVDFPASSFNGSDYTFLPYYYGGNGSRLKGAYIYGDGQYAEVTLELGDYAYPIQKLADGDENTAEYTLASGKTWTIYCNKSFEGTDIIGWYASTAPEGLSESEDKTFYLTVQYSTSYDIKWTSVEELLPILETWDAGIQVIPE